MFLVLRGAPNENDPYFISGYSIGVGDDITDEQLWLMQSDNDLQVNVMGNESRVTIAGWFVSTEDEPVSRPISGLRSRGS